MKVIFCGPSHGIWKKLIITCSFFKYLSPGLAISGLADHDAVVVESDISLITNRQEPRKILLFNKADWDAFVAYMEDFNLQWPEREDGNLGWPHLRYALR